MSVSSATAREARGPGQVSEGRLVLHQLRYDLLALWRDPRSRFFTFSGKLRTVSEPMT